MFNKPRKSDKSINWKSGKHVRDKGWLGLYDDFDDKVFNSF